MCFGFGLVKALGKKKPPRRRKEKKKGATHDHHAPPPPLPLPPPPLEASPCLLARTTRFESCRQCLSFLSRRRDVFFSWEKSNKIKNPKLPLSSSRGEYFFVCFFLNNNTFFFGREERDFTDETSLAVSRYIYHHSLLRFCSSGLCRDE